MQLRVTQAGVLGGPWSVALSSLLAGVGTCCSISQTCSPCLSDITAKLLESKRHAFCEMYDVQFGWMHCVSHLSWRQQGVA